jgi:hypothetical protein
MLPKSPDGVLPRVRDAGVSSTKYHRAPRDRPTYCVPPRTHDDGRRGTVVVVAGAAGASGAPGASVCVIVMGCSYSKVGRGRRHPTSTSESSNATAVHRMIAE